MRQLLKSLVLAAGLLLAAAPAHAGIPIPCTGEAIVKVLDLNTADIAAAQPTKTGKPPRKIDLGYKFSGCTGGTWVGYVGEGRNYLALPEETLRILLAKSGHSDFPPVPSFMGTFSASWVVWLWIAAFSAAPVMGVFSFVFGNGIQSAPVGEPPAAPVPASAFIGSARAPSPAPISAATRPVAQTPMGPNATAASARSIQRGPNIQARLAGSPGFGRRA